MCDARQPASFEMVSCAVLQGIMWLCLPLSTVQCLLCGIGNYLSVLNGVSVSVCTVI